MLVLPYFVQVTLANAVTSWMFAGDSLAPPAAVTCNKKHRSQKYLQSYSEVVSYLLKKVATDCAIAELEASTLRYMQHMSMTTQQYADNNIAEL